MTAAASATKSPQWQSCFRPNLFQGKVALVTGGGTGLGRAIAFELATLGATVVIASRNQETCLQAATEMNHALLQQQQQQSCGKVKVGPPTSIGNEQQQQSCGKVKVGPPTSIGNEQQQQSCGKVNVGPSTSIRNEQDIQNLISHILETYGSLDMLVNNAGGQFVSPAEDLTTRGFGAVVATNLQGTFVCCREAYTQWMKDHGGSIVNITLGNRNGMPLMAHSGAARAGVENMTKTLCTEWIESGVRINCVRPGIIWTESGFKNYGPAGDTFVERILPTLPAKRFGSPEEVSSAVVWLLCPGASYVTGTVLSVDGASAYTFLPLIEIEDESHLPVYGRLPRKAKL